MVRRVNHVIHHAAAAVLFINRLGPPLPRTRFFQLHGHVEQLLQDPSKGFCSFLGVNDQGKVSHRDHVNMTRP